MRVFFKKSNEKDLNEAGAAALGSGKTSEPKASLSPEEREKAGRRAGIAGIISNLVLCAFKVLTGFVSGSVSIIADGVNNAGDASASLMTAVGFKLAGKKPSKEHPYGYGRTEYVAGLAVSIMIIAVGFSLLTTSIRTTLRPEPVDLSLPGILVLVASIGAKFLQMTYFNSVGAKISSDTLTAAAADSRNDMLTTAAVLIAALIGKFTKLQLDGPAGVIVAIFILISGAGLVKDTLSPILGKAPDPELVKKLKEAILSDPNILGVHDLIIHDYGPGRIFATVHAEVDADSDIMNIHDAIDNIESDVYNTLRILLTVHMDPLNTKDPLTAVVNTELAEIQKELPEMHSFHDVRVVSGPTHINVVFDAVLAHGAKATPEKLREKLTEKLKERNPKYVPVITVDRFYE